MGKVLQSRKNTARKRFKAAGGSTSWWPCSCIVLATLYASQGKPGSCASASLACLQGGRAARHDKTFCLWLLAGKLAPKKAVPARRVPMLHKSTATQSRLWCPAKPISAAWMLCLSQCSAAGASLRGLLMTSGYHSKTTLFPVFYCHATVVHFIIPCVEH